MDDIQLVTLFLLGGLFVVCKYCTAILSVNKISFEHMLYLVSLVHI